MTVSGTRKASFAGGVHPPERKLPAAEAAIQVLPTPEVVRVPLWQHLGAPCEAVVKPRTEVALGDIVGEAKAFVSAPVHASVTGTVARASVATLPNGRHVPVVTIKAADKQPWAGDALWEEIFGGRWPTDGLDQYEPQEIAERARRAGLVGLGGAAFPTHVKLTRNEKKPIDRLLVNGCECEPYLTADHRLMLEAPEPVITGALLARRATGARQVVICVEENKPQAIDSLRSAAQGTGIEIRALKTRYPQGGEKQLVVTVVGKEVPTGGLPLDVGAVVINVGTAAALARAVVRAGPLTHRIVTVSGAGIHQPKNLLAPIGASYRELVDFCGGLATDAVRVVAGGPMMGFTLGSLDVPLTKGTSGVTVLSRDEVRKARQTACVRCGRCIDVCPLRLVPTRLALASRVGDVELAKRYYISACMECGCCAYVCPASIPLVQLIRVGKVMVQNE
ncbi:MAG TPA: electron transport complex subunit RsxC [Thermoguttaceae bacterium]|nr:electron transport complex subunit RsxC [Thermoguttaceae bacterium]